MILKSLIKSDRHKLSILASIQANLHQSGRECFRLGAESYSSLGRVGKNSRKYSRPLWCEFACGKFWSPRLYRLKMNNKTNKIHPSFQTLKKYQRPWIVYMPIMYASLAAVYEELYMGFAFKINCQSISFITSFFYNIVSTCIQDLWYIVNRIQDSWILYFMKSEFWSTAKIAELKYCCKWIFESFDVSHLKITIRSISYIN